MRTIHDEKPSFGDTDFDYDDEAAGGIYVYIYSVYLEECRKNLIKTPYYSAWFQPKTDGADFGKQGYHRKGHLKRSRMVQISAP